MSTAKNATGRRRRSWARLGDDALLDLRFRDLDLGLDGTLVARLFDEVASEVAERGLRFRPHVWISDEWFTPDDVPGIAVPFYLTHPRLARLEQRQVLEVEGSKRDACLRILRHEFGHAIDNAFALRRRPKRRRIFGSPEKAYPDHYSPRPFSKRYVLHLDSWYAQSHPDEDFAETFAVWLSPRSRWRSRYAGWPALAKLEYMDELMGSLRGRTPVVRTKRKVDPVTTMTKTLRAHYAEKRARYEADSPGFYDRDLLRLFVEARASHSKASAAVFLERMRRDIRLRVARWSATHPYTIDQVIKEMAQRCRELDLRIEQSEDLMLIDCTVMLTVQVMNYVRSGRHRIVL